MSYSGIAILHIQLTCNVNFKSRAQDIMPKSINYLLTLDTGCVFGDITAVFSDTVKADFESHRLGGELDQQRALTASSSMCAMLYCYRHKCYCMLKRSLMATAGTPCQDCSPANAARLMLAGPRPLVTLSWIQIIRRLMEIVFIHENVPVAHLVASPTSPA